MRNVWLVLVTCGLQLCQSGLCPSGLMAAEKNRDWKTGQIVESDETAAALHTIATADRNYLVRGTIGSGDQELGVGATVRFAVEGKAMFISLAGKEYRLYVLGERVAAPKDLREPEKNALPPPKSPAPSVAAAKPAPEVGEVLDNDAVVKMIVAGLKEDTIVRVIETRPGKYTLTKDALAGLKAAGVPQSVIAAMSAKMTAKH